MSGLEDDQDKGGGQDLAYSTNQQMAMNAQLLQQHASHQQQLILQQFWMNVMNEIQNINPDQEDFKSHSLPLARIKKIMKSEEEILNEAPNAPNSRFMISAEAPIMFAKACEIFIAELTTRSWGHTEENKRRTLQRNDISVAVSKTDTYDFLIDIVPREEIKPGEEPVQRPINAAGPLGPQGVEDPNLMYQQMQMAQVQHVQAQMAQMDPAQQMQYMQMMAQHQNPQYAQMMMYQQQQIAQQMAQLAQQGHMGQDDPNLPPPEDPQAMGDPQSFEQQQALLYQQAMQQQQQQQQMQQMQLMQQQQQHQQMRAGQQ